MDWKPKLQFSNFYPNLTLPPLNLINTSDLHHCCCCSSPPQIRSGLLLLLLLLLKTGLLLLLLLLLTIGLLLLLPLLRSFVILLYLSWLVYPLHFFMNFGDCVDCCICELWLFMDWCVASCVDHRLVCVCGFILITL